MNTLPTVTLLAIGGAMDISGPGAVLREFHRLAGGAAARFVIVPTASTLVDAGCETLAALQRLGVAQAEILPLRTRQQALEADCRAIEQADAIFFAGGNQLRLTSFLGGTAVEAALMSAYRRGAIVGGSSAGAAVLSRIMLAYGKSGATPRSGQAQFVSGLGFTERVIFDQHFRQRDRLGRLIYAVSNHPGLLGVGVDEDTAAILEGEQLRVVGRSAVTIVDAQRALSDVADLAPQRPIAIAGLQVHVLTAGCSFNLATRQAHIPEKALAVD